MRKNVCIALSALVITLTAASCSKSYNCHCIYKDNGTVTHEDDHHISEGSKEKSAASCDKMDNTTTSVVNTYTSITTTECELTN